MFFYCTQSTLARSLVGRDSDGESADSSNTLVRSLFKMSSSKNPLSTLPTVDYFWPLLITSNNEPQIKDLRFNNNDTREDEGSSTSDWALVKSILINSCSIFWNDNVGILMHYNSQNCSYKIQVTLSVRMLTLAAKRIPNQVVWPPSLIQHPTNSSDDYHNQHP